jgi:hypothetical protein
MRHFTTIPVAVVFACCLALVFPSRAEAKVTHQQASCPDPQQLSNGSYGCTVPSGVRPPGHGGGGNPSDWGICGILSLSGKFGPKTVIEIVVDASGYYAVSLENNSPSDVPTAEMTCVLFTDFKGGPPASDASSFGPPPPGFSHNGTIKSSAENACIWAGLSGNLITIDQAAQEAGGEAAAQFSVSDTVISSANVTSYTYCVGYSSASWKGWTFVSPKPNFTTPPSVISLGLNDGHDWCYMQGIYAHLNFFEDDYDAYISASKAISAGLDLSSGGNYSMAATPAGGISVSYNCLPLKQ